MLTVRRPRMFFFGLAVLLLLFTANHLEYLLRQQRPSDPQQPDVVVSAEQGPAGHSTLGIVESASRATGGRTVLTFATLGEWQFDPKTPPPCPEPVKALSGRDVSCLGFMYPLQSGERLKVFCLLRSTQTCCYGPKPQFNQYLLVEMSEPVKFERLTPVTVTGRFFVDPRPDEGFIYRIEGTSVQPAADNVPDVDPVQASREAGLTLFDFALLASMERQAEAARSVPAELLALDGRRVVLEGWVMDRTQDQPPRLIVERPAASGVPPLPTLFNAVLIVPLNARQVPPVWKQKAVFSGVIRVTQQPSAWPQRGVVRLADAVLGVPKSDPAGTGQARPRVSWVWEAAALGVLVLLTIRPKCSSHSAVPRG